MLIAPFALLLSLAAEPPAPPASPATPVADAVSEAASTTAAAESAAAQKSAKKDNDGVRFTWKEHPSVRAGKWLRLDFTGRVQGDKMFPGDDPAKFDDLILRRLRGGVDGELFGFIQFSIERDFTRNSTTSIFAESTKTAWRDLFGEIKVADGLQIRGGRFKVPFSRDQLDGEASNDFVNRSLGGDYLAPGRDTGGMVHGRFFKRALTYNVGVFQHDGDNSRSNKIAGGDRTVAARVTVAPLGRIKFANLDETDFGVSYATTDVTDEPTLPNGLRGRTVVSQYTFFQPVFVNGTRRRLGADVEWNRHQFGMRAEVMQVNDQRIDQALRGGTLNDAVYHAWYASGVWVLTGEKAEKAIDPKHPLFRGGFGALQVAARYERIWYDSKATGEPAFSNSRAEVILPNGDKVLTLGMNWYPIRLVKLQWNSVHETIEDIGRTPMLDGSTKFWSGVFRVQFSL